MPTPMPAPRPVFLIRLTHTGVHADGRENVNAVLINDLDVGYQDQNNKVPVYVPVDGFIDIPGTSRSLFSYEQGTIRKFHQVGVIKAQLFITPETYTVAELPDPAEYPSGAYVWNSTTGQPMFSDGSKWRDPNMVSFDRYIPEEAIYPQVTPATPGFVGDANTIEFVDGAISDVVFASIADAAYNTPFSINIFWYSATATAGDVLWEVSLVRQRTGDLVTRPFAAAQTVLSTAPGVAFTLAQAVIPFSLDSEADNIAALDPYRIQIRRNGADGADTMAGTASLITATFTDGI